MSRFVNEATTGNRTMNSGIRPATIGLGMTSARTVVSISAWSDNLGPSQTSL